MFKFKFRGQQVGLDKDGSINFDSAKTDNMTQSGWCATQKEMDEVYFRREISVNDLFEKKYKFVHDLIFAIEQFEKETGVSIEFIKFDWDTGLDMQLDI